MVNITKEYVVRIRTKGSGKIGTQHEIKFSNLDDAERFYEHQLKLKENYHIELFKRMISESRIKNIKKKL
ncbi:hypothetical protein [Clostridioides sp. ZZV14-6044]|uniref:hypothetical protein n=1 Tax=unclassified Clostridioides TaxID=2635829 RepID=UPI001D0F6321|nr:hypothetical protein [Clostridioides sp. ZZV14-6104]MCC0744588.1 hypothetical protein [Clostridioides sp. ZZV14-6044]